MLPGGSFISVIFFLCMNEQLPGDHSEHPPFEYSVITENIYLGTNGCCVSHFEKSLVDMGVHADISLEEERLDAAQGAEYFLWLPTKDQTAPSMGALRTGTHTMKELIETGEKVYVHCRNGHGRGPSLVVAYFILMGDDFEIAHAKVKAKRDVIHLNDEQVERLKEFETWCREEHDSAAD
jgi:dual specificity MAP kinase phosphatase